MGVTLTSHLHRPASGDPAASSSDEALLATLLTAAWFVEARDPYTGGHLWRVSRYVRLLADAAGLDPLLAVQASLGGFLHDLGKVAVPDAILRKPSRLTEDEFAVIRTHPEVGARMLAAHPLAGLVRDAILLHHERPDGRGYPFGYGGEAVPVTARLVGICDAFDAMTSHRVYRAGRPRDVALGVLLEEAGLQFDAGFVETFVSLGRAGGLDEVIGHTDVGIPLHSCPMCGPLIVVRSGQGEGDQVYCPNCSSEFVLRPEGVSLTPFHTGRKGTASQVQPVADGVLIGRTVREALAQLPSGELARLARSAQDPGSPV
jgi:predicted RNA-binding Zn-ribbon protein involved in translation (DUF1610 family)